MKRIAALLALSTLVARAGAAPGQALPAMPAGHRALTRTISYGEMEAFLKSVDGKGPVRVSVEGETTKGRSIYLVRLSRTAQPAWKILFYAQQHGDEISGKDALLYLIREVSENPEHLPEGVGVWILPMMNPDGAEAGTRENSASADINRDHVSLEQPETRALYRVVQRVRPEVAVDCHEFAREPEAWRKVGWTKWPDITMDGLNNPLFDRAVVQAGQRWVGRARDAATQAGHAFLRYWVGGLPPDDEQRLSAPDIDSGMNGVGAYGGLSFIIEAAARRGEDAAARELGNRIDAYLVLLRRFVQGDGHRADDAAAVREARARSLPPFLPTNYLWVNPRAEVTRFPVLETATGRTLEIPTANMMTEIAVKRTVPTPLAYVVEPRAAAEIGALLDRHAIPYGKLPAARSARVELCTLLRVEDEFDEVYSRYEGRQIVRREPAAVREAPAGSLWVPLTGEAAIRAALILEPTAMYGLYAYPQFRALAGPGGALPVLRVVR